MSCILACDIGATSIRAALVDRRGEIIACRRAEAPREGTGGGRSEVEADAWWLQFEALASALAADNDAALRTVEAVAVCGVTRTQVILGGDGRPLRPAITWRDTRAETDAARLLARLPAAHPERARVNAFHPLARLAWLKEHEPETVQAAVAVIEPKDYVNFRLTGRIATDAISSARLLAAAARADGGSLLAAAGLPDTIVPPCLEPTEAVGPIASGQKGALARLEGRPVFCLANDTWAAVLGMGALRPGHAFNISGTTEVIGVVGAAPAVAEGLMSVPWGDGLHQLGGPSQNGADTAAWLLELLGAPGGEIGSALERLLERPRNSQPVLFLPYLQGERTPHWDSALRGAALGLNRGHTASDLGWSVLEGIAFLNRLVLERAEAALGTPVVEIRFGGGGAANETWCQVKADITERTIVVGACAEPGLAGCALAARVGLKQYPALAAAQEALVRTARRYPPRPEYADTYRRLYALYRDAETALRPLSHALSTIDGRRDRLPGVPANAGKEMLPQ